VAPEGSLLHQVAFLDLDVFHKGFARARDERGWFHIDRSGKEVYSSRFEMLEPFYNGQALARRRDGRLVVIDESGMDVTSIAVPDREWDGRLEGLGVGYWPVFALKLGLEAGLAGGETRFTPTPAAKEALLAAWKEMGLISRDGDLTPKGERLRPGLPSRTKVDFWLGSQLGPWLAARPILEGEGAPEFFSEVAGDHESSSVAHSALNVYAEKDWDGIAGRLPVSEGDVVVDIGGGLGAMLRDVKRAFPSARCVLFERPEVAAVAQRGKGFEVVAGDFFSCQIPRADIYLLARVLHDWPDDKAREILARLHSSCPPTAKLCVIERVVRRPGQHGLLSLHMLLTQGSRERSGDEWRDLFRQTGWIEQHVRDFRGHEIVVLVKAGRSAV
jgi:hypothetical protein